MGDDIVNCFKKHLHEIDPNPEATQALCRIVTGSMVDKAGDPRQLAMEALVITTDAMTSMAAPVSACSAGCDHCCKSMEVTVHAVEAERIVQYVRQLPYNSRRILTKKLRKQAHAEASRREKTYRRACAFLKNSRCSIYDIRPLACRRWMSSDIRDCAGEQNLNDLNHAQTLSMIIGVQTTIAYVEATDDVAMGFLGGSVLEAMK